MILPTSCFCLLSSTRKYNDIRSPGAREFVGDPRHMVLLGEEVMYSHIGLELEMTQRQGTGDLIGGDLSHWRVLRSWKEAERGR